MFKIGEMYVLLKPIPACTNGNTTGSINSYVTGGEGGYTYFWNNGFAGSSLNASTGTYSITVSDNTGQTVSASAVIQACPDVVMNLKLFIQGFANGPQSMTPAIVNQGRFNWPVDVDSIDVELRADSIGYPLKASFRGVLHSDGNLACYFYSSTIAGSSCYVVIKHRNSTETWSAMSVLMTAQCNYDFSDMASKAFGNNQADISGNGSSWAIYSGDINRDLNIDLLDLSRLEEDINNFGAGYISTDLNGDGNTDLLDNPLIEEDISNFIFAIRP